MVNAKEASVLCRYVKALCPQQQFDEFSPDAWFDLLGELSLELARVAARNVARRQPFVAPSEILGEVARMRKLVGKRVGPAVDVAEGDLPFDVAQYLAAMRRRAVRTRELTDEAIIRGFVRFGEIDVEVDLKRLGLVEPRAAISGVPHPFVKQLAEKLSIERDWRGSE